MAFIWYIVTIYLTNMFSILGDMAGGSTAEYLRYVTWLNKGIFAFLLLLNIGNIFNNCKKSMLLLMFLLIIVTVFSAIIEPEDSRFYESVRDFIVVCLPPMLLVSSVNRYEILLRGLSRVSVPVLISSGLVLLASFKFSFAGYYMGFSSALVIPICIAVYDFFGNGKFIRLLLAGVGILSVLVLGSRGALLSIFAYIVTCYLFTNKIRKDGSRRKSFEPKKLLAIVPAVFLAIFSRTIIQFAYDFLYARGILSRTLWTFLYHYISPARAEIYSAYIASIKEHPFAIRGIGGDSVLSDAYAHNFVLEALAEFGVVIGGIFLMIITIYIMKLYTLDRKKECYEVENLLFCASIPVMLVSGTFWNTAYFWSWFAVMAKNKEKRIEKIT